MYKPAKKIVTIISRFLWHPNSCGWK